MRVSGRGLPCQAGRAVILQRRVAGRWQRIGSAHMSRCVADGGVGFSTYSVRGRARTTGRQIWRVQLASRRPWATGRSRNLTLTVLAHPVHHSGGGGSTTPPTDPTGPTEPPPPHG